MENTKGQKSIHILLVDSNPTDREVILDILSTDTSVAYHLKTVSHSTLVSKSIKSHEADVIILELPPPQSPGLKALDDLRKRMKTTPIIIIAEPEFEETARKAIDKGADDYLIRRSFSGRLFFHILRYTLHRRRVERELLAREEQFRSLVSSIPGVIYQYRYQPNGTWSAEFVSDAIGEITGYPASDFVRDAKRAYASIIHPEDIEIVTKIVQKAAKKGSSYNMDYRISHLDGSTRWVHEQGRCIVNEKGKTQSMHGAIFDMTDHAKTEAELNRLTFYDPVTNLPNRMLFVDRLNQALAQAHRENYKCAVFFLDLDHFKRINDNLGHGLGDQLLQMVSQRLERTVYETDTVTRVGGDGFTLLLPVIRQTRHAVKVADKLMQAFQEPFFIEGHEIFVTCSIGICFFPDDGRDGDELLRHADTAMYHAKDRGRNNYQFFSASMSAKAVERFDMENLLRHALELDELTIHYQPLVNLRSGRISGMEALIRWDHPKLGFIYPSDFIPVAEDTGLIVPIGEWVLRKSCEQLKRWHEMGYRDLRISVNLSARQFQYLNLTQTVGRVLKETGLESDCLQLELTEGTIMQNIDETVMILRELNGMGLGLSIDDFGTGYSSLGSLKRFPIRTLKIDKTFVRDITVDPDDATIVKAIISLAHSLKLNVVAEGVETEEQLKFLKTLHCDEIQGYLYSKPLSAENASRLLSGKKSRIPSHWLIVGPNPYFFIPTGLRESIWKHPASKTSQE